MAQAGGGNTSHLDCKNLHQYLRTLPTKLLDQLYTHPATCLAVFQDLDSLAKTFIMRMLFLEQALPKASISTWVKSEHSGEYLEAERALAGLRIWQEQQLPGGLMGWVLNGTFQSNLKVALLGGGSPWSGSRAMNDVDKYGKDIKYLDTYALERWECVLHFMVGSKEACDGVSKDVVSILLHAGLMKCDAGDSLPAITPSGFHFLLMNTAAQVWYFMLQYLDTLESRGINLVECLSFLFQLSFSKMGKDYSTDGMTESQLPFMQHLREIGLIYQRKRKSQRYYPTRLAINLVSGLNQSSADAHREGFLVVETNYRVYAYTCSPLQIALLALFCEMLYRFPNFCVCVLTRESVRQALICGITAEQILNFLRSHAHPEALKKTPVIPPTISDQVRLWEIERDRFKFSDGVLYNQFLSAADFEMLRDYAKDLNVLVWEKPKNRVMIVSKAGHDDVKRFWKRHKTS
ncbi:unnamed protein product [Owenia fusiformis]|uniref:General transcription factor IIH subunit 4 n=1 Tax=Owenia fusiformis TaxID=6347 RepID=A0A8S4NQM8_OWEFU|nr:unnamed protein product [Owenia fusiformis]